MKVISGNARGKSLKPISYDKIRPTASVVKEAVMNIVQFRIAGASVLDLFAGTGQMGIELLSRGAGRAVLVDNNNTAVNTIKENLETTGLMNKATVEKAEVFSFLESNHEKYDIIFLDPPYGEEILPKILPKITKFLNPDGIIVCEGEKKDKLPESINGFIKSKDYTYGIRKINVYKKQS